MVVALQSRVGFIEEIFIGPQGVYWDRIAILAGGGAAILISLFAYETFVAGPAGRREEGHRLMKKAMPELVVFLLRDSSGRIPASLPSKLRASGLKMQPADVEVVAVNFGYSDALYLNELSKRASLMAPSAKDVLVEAALRIAYTDGSDETSQRAQRLIGSLGRLSNRSAQMAISGLPEELRRSPA
jgi:hypothetical protein